jgi:hypothetical protein
MAQLLLHFNNYFHFLIPVIKSLGRSAFISIRSVRKYCYLIPVAPSGASGICETLAPDPANSNSFNLLLCLPHFSGFFLDLFLLGLFGTAAPSSPLGVPV